MRIILSLFILFSFSNANIIYSFNIYMAQKKYLQHKNRQALAYYQHIRKKNSIIYFDIADILYKQKRFYEALTNYKKVTSKQLFARKYYNMANCYVRLARLQEAVYFYKKNLKIEYDKNAVINLKRIETVLKKRKKKKVIKIIHMTTKIHSGSNKIQKTAHHSTKKPQDYGKKKNQKLTSKGYAKNMDTKHQRLSINLSIVKLNVKNSNKMTKLQEQRWNEILHHQGLQTLLIPINKGKIHDTQNNW